jgi:hypothetical protein
MHPYAVWGMKSVFGLYYPGCWFVLEDSKAVRATKEFEFKLDGALMSILRRQRSATLQELLREAHLGFDTVFCIPLIAQASTQLDNELACSESIRQMWDHVKLPSAGNILKLIHEKMDHAISTICPAKFKVGVTANPPDRFGPYHCEGYTKMYLLFRSDSSIELNTIEAHLIDRYTSHPGIQNTAHGGDGNLCLSRPPYFVYCVVGQA